MYFVLYKKRMAVKRWERQGQGKLVLRGAIFTIRLHYFVDMFSLSVRITVTLELAFIKTHEFGSVKLYESSEHDDKLIRRNSRTF